MPVAALHDREGDIGLDLHPVLQNIDHECEVISGSCCRKRRLKPVLDIQNQDILADFHHLGFLILRHLEHVQKQEQLEKVDDLRHPASMLVWPR